MSQLWQHILVLLLVGACLTFVVWQGAKALGGRRSKLGSCCSKGCSTQEHEKAGNPSKIQFLPAEMLGRRK